MEINFVPKNNIEPKKGKILLSEPFLEDPYFKRTVVLLCEHNEEGSFGFVLNNYIELTLDQIMESLPGHGSRISIGGPVNNSNLYYIHTLGDQVEESIEVVEGIYMGGNFEVLRDIRQNGEVKHDQIRFFVGYSGWSPKQLDSELETNSWFVTQVKKEVLMNTRVKDLWKKIMSGLGKKGEMIANLPDDPKLN